jgi:hypothetical protein
MKKIIYFFIFIFCVLIILIGLPKNNQVKTNLGNGFHFIPFEERIFDATSFSGNGIYLFKNNLMVPVILPNITSYQSDSLYIVVKQNFDVKQTNILFENMIFMPKTYFLYDKQFVPINEEYVNQKNIKNDITSQAVYVKSILYKNKKILKMIKNKENYYIIEKKSKNILGPLNYQEYLLKRKSIGVDEDLKLIN